MPVKPMLVSSGPLPGDSDRYAFEVKWDGFRSLIHADPRRVTVWSRNGHDMTDRYRELWNLSSAVEDSILLDGEIVALDDLGKPDFASLWFRSRGSSHRPVCFMVFDVLKVGDENLLDRGLRERRQILESLELDGPYWRTPQSHIGEGEALFAATKAMGLEGVVAKRLDSRYRPGLRSRSWIKSKHFQIRTFALLGWIAPQQWRGDRGCVVLGLRSQSGIVCAGVLESGYGRDLVERLPELTRADLRILQTAGRVWEGSDPLMADVKYLEWSPAGGLRHATLMPSSAQRSSSVSLGTSRQRRR